MLLIRGILNSFGRGGDNGQRIRDGILEIMHRHKIPRRGSHIEQWHQKLHNNTTPDDIGICEAMIAFNQTNDMNKYWEVLSHHGISKERLASFERPVTMDPIYMPHIVNDLYDFLKILKSVHSGTDLITSIEAARSCLNGEVNKYLGDILVNMNNWDKISQIERAVRARVLINQTANRGDINQYREALYVDIALENYIRQLCESIIHLDISPKNLLRELTLLIDNASITIEDQEFSIASDDWKTISDRYMNTFESDKTQVLIIKAAADRIVRVLGTCVDTYNHLIDPKAKTLGEQFGADPETVEMFTEEIIRGSSLFSLSIILKKIDFHLRNLANLKPWQIISPLPHISGRLVNVSSLTEVAYEIFKEPTILIAKRVTGEEEIPAGVTGVISITELDALAHVSVRARNSKVLLAVCFNEEEMSNLENLIGQTVKLSMISGGIVAQISDEITVNNQETAIIKTEIKRPLPIENVAISFEEFGEGKTGAKANNCLVLRRSLPNYIGVPNSVALPYGLCERVLNYDLNSERLSRYEQEIEKLESLGHNSAEESLNTLKSIILELEIAHDDILNIQSQLDTIGTPRDQ